MPKIEERIAAGIQYRSMELASQEDSHIVAGYASTFNQPYVLMAYDGAEYREQVDPGAFQEADMKDVIFQYNHEGRVFARTRNNTLTVRTDEKGLYIEAELGGTEAGRQLYEEIKNGYTDRMSFGFTVLDDDWATFTEARDGVETLVHLRTITRIGKLYDVSAVSIPANDFTEISARSLTDAMEQAEARKAEERNRMKKKIKIYLEGFTNEL